MGWNVLESVGMSWNELGWVEMRKYGLECVGMSWNENGLIGLE